MARREINEVLAESSRLVEAGRYRDNESLMRLALVRFPDSAEIALRAAYALRSGARDRARYLAQRAVELSSDDREVLFHAAWLLADLHDFKSARRYIRRLRGMLTEDFPYLFDFTVLFGRTLMENGNLAEAEHNLKLVFGEAPTTRGAGFALAELYLQQGRLDEALEVVRAAQEHQPDEPSLVALELRIHEAAEGGSGPEA